MVQTFTATGGVSDGGFWFNCDADVRFELAAHSGRRAAPSSDIFAVAIALLPTLLTPYCPSAGRAGTA